MATIILYPNAAGDLTQFTPNTGANWQCVDETPQDSDTTYNQSVAMGAPRGDLLNLQPVTGAIPAGSTIDAVQLIVVAKYISAMSQIGGKWKSGATSLDQSPVNMTTSYAAYQWTRLTNLSGGAWTMALVDALQVGYLDNARASGGARVTQVRVVVTYTEPAAATDPGDVQII